MTPKGLLGTKEVLAVLWGAQCRALPVFLFYLAGTAIAFGLDWQCLAAGGDFPAVNIMFNYF